MKRIYKYNIPISSTEPLFVPAGARFLSLTCQNDIPVVYFVTDSASKKMDKYYFKVLGTGWDIDDEEWHELEVYYAFLDTIQLFDGKLIWHVWITYPEDVQFLEDKWAREREVKYESK